MIVQSFLALCVMFLLIVGTIFTLVAAIGLIKLDNPMSRLHAPTKAGTVGIGAFLLASMLHGYMLGEGSMHELLVMGFLFITAPISANFMAKVNIHKQSCIVPPTPPRDDTWSTLNVSEADRDVADQQAEA